MSADTIVPNFSNPQSLNRYTYVLNSPLALTDPSGHCAYGGYDHYSHTPIRSEDDLHCWETFDDIDEFMANNPEYAETIGWGEKRNEYQQKNYGNLRVLRSMHWKGAQQPPSCWGGMSSRCPRDQFRQFFGIQSPDAIGINISASGSGGVHANMGAEAVLNLDSYELTLFLIPGGGGSVGVGGSYSVSGVAIFNLGKDNYDYRGSFVDVNGTAALGPGATAGHAWVPGGRDEGARSYYAGVAMGAEASGNISYSEYVPTITINLKSLTVDYDIVPYSMELFLDRIFKGN